MTAIEKAKDLNTLNVEDLISYLSSKTISFPSHKLRKF